MDGTRVWDSLEGDAVLFSASLADGSNVRSSRMTLSMDRRRENFMR